MIVPGGLYRSSRLRSGLVHSGVPDSVFLNGDPVGLATHGFSSRCDDRAP